MSRLLFIFNTAHTPYLISHICFISFISNGWTSLSINCHKTSGNCLDTFSFLNPYKCYIFYHKWMTYVISTIGFMYVLFSYYINSMAVQNCLGSFLSGNICQIPYTWYHKWMIFFDTPLLISTIGFMYVLLLYISFICTMDDVHFPPFCHKVYTWYILWSIGLCNSYANTLT